MDVDIDAAGAVSTRQKFATVAPLAQGLGILSGAGLLLVQDGGSILRVNIGATVTTTTLVSGLNATARVAFHAHAGQVFWSNGIVSGRITADGAALNWGCSVCPTPTLTTAVGTLPAGDYLVAATFLDASGIEHGAGVAAAVTLNGAHSIAASVGTLDPAATHVRFYLAGPDDDALYRVGDVAVGSLPAAITTLPTADYQCDRVGLAPPPPASAILSYGDYLVLVDGAWLWPSVGAASHLYEIGRLGWQVPETILSGAGVDDGFWAVTAKDAYWFQGGGEPHEWRMRALNLGFGFAAGALVIGSASIPGLGLQGNARVAVFVSERGPGFGLPSGQMLFPTRGTYHVDAVGKRAHIAYRTLVSAGASIGQLVFAVE